MADRVNREKLLELGFEGSVIFENPHYDSAMVGVFFDGRVVYDYDLMVKHLMDEDGMTEEDAIEFIEYNTIRALPYFPNHPIIYRNYDDCEEE